MAGDGKFLALENLAGTTELLNLDNIFTGEVIGGPYRVKAKIDGTLEDCLLVFLKESVTVSVILYRITGNTLVTIFNELYYGSETMLVDAVTYPENGVDIIYYTDGVNELRKLRLEFTSPIGTFTTQEISLQRRAPLGDITFFHGTGGSLLTGSYQFSFRFYNTDTRAYSKWSLLTNPALISKDGTFPTGNYGLASNKKLTVSISDIPTSEQSVWTHIQVAVIENTTETRPVTASLQPIQSFAGATASYEYKSNDSIGTISLTDIVVDLAALEYVKTLSVKNNRLFGANIKYKELDYDRIPAATGSVRAEAISQTYGDANASYYKGHFRDEVYRYYAVYWDDKYNFYRPYRLDMSSITANQIANGDMRYPARNQSGGAYTLMDGSNNFLSLGLNLTVNNHPSGARGVAIFRAKRKKRKLFQTPLIPSVEIQGIGALGEYPNIANESPVNAGSATEREYASATPMNPAGTIAPANLFYTKEQHIVQRIVTDTTTGKNLAGEVYYSTSDVYTGPAKSIFYTFEPLYTYNQTPYQFTGAESYRIIDFAYLRLDYTAISNKPDSSYKYFDYLNTSLHGTFYANRNADYYQRYTNVSAAHGAVYSIDGNIVSTKPTTNYGEGTTIGGNFLGTYSNLETGGISFQSVPNNQRAVAIQVDKSFGGAALRAETLYPGQIPATYFKTGGQTPNALSVLNTANNVSSIDVSGFTENSTYVQAIEIADVELDLDDNRYGTADTIHEMEFTGAMHTFTDAELATVISTGNVPVAFVVYGGDCWVSLHSFKITDSHYAVTNTGKFCDTGGTFNPDSQDDLIKKWTRFFRNKAGQDAICMPVPLKNVSQVLSVVLESEVHGQITAPRPYTSEVSGTTDVPTVPTDGESQFRISFPYLYNGGYIRNSDQKVLIPYNANENITYTYPARGVYSDQKVYNTDIQGFDSFPVGNIVDLEETYGGITKLGLVGDNLFALQERGIALIPVDASTLSTTDAQTISVRSGTTDIPIYVSRINGTQHMKAVQVLSDKIIFPDNRTSQIFILGGTELRPISEQGAINRTKQKIGTQLASNQLFSAYDEIKRQYYLFKPDGFCLVWDDRLELWQDQLELSTGTNRFYGAVRVNNTLYGLGRDGSTLKVSTMYTGSPNQFWGATVTPRVTFVANPDYEFAKTFDSLIAYSTDPLATADISGEKETGATGFVVTGMNFDVSRREGYYIIPVLRDSNGARIRSTRADITLKWPTDAIVSLSEAVTKYRISSRAI